MEAKPKERDADELQRLVDDGERNIHRLCTRFMVNWRQRGDVQREQEWDERRLAEISINLEMYKRDVQNPQRAAIEMQAEKERPERLFDA